MAGLCCGMKTAPSVCRINAPIKVTDDMTGTQCQYSFLNRSEGNKKKERAASVFLPSGTRAGVARPVAALKKKKERKGSLLSVSDTSVEDLRIAAAN